MMAEFKVGMAISRLDEVMRLPRRAAAMVGG
jgi:hypothetical protein